jgi:hypothetical protein
VTVCGKGGGTEQILDVGAVDVGVNGGGGGMGVVKDEMCCMVWLVEKSHSRMERYTKG